MHTCTDTYCTHTYGNSCTNTSYHICLLATYTLGQSSPITHTQMSHLHTYTHTRALCVHKQIHKCHNHTHTELMGITNLHKDFGPMLAHTHCTPLPSIYTPLSFDTHALSLSLHSAHTHTHTCTHSLSAVHTHICTCTLSLSLCSAVPGSPQCDKRGLHMCVHICTLLSQRLPLLPPGPLSAGARMPASPAYLCS